ncbi:MAG TPA: hypothetical protein DCS15_00215 [Flavobacteriales bacterium]|nr:hypothetical protein [Flavobacteriales bacterium]
MRTLILTVLMSSLFLGGFAQKSKITSAFNHLKWQELDKAKEAIDLASEHENTKDFWKTWLYKARVYIAIANDTAPKYQPMKLMALNTALDAYIKFAGYDQNKQNKEDVKKEALRGILAQAYAGGGQSFQNSDFKGAYDFFQVSARLHETIGLMDTIAVYNSALAAENAGDWANAELNYRKCIEVNYKAESCFNDMSMIYYKKADSVDKALEVLAEGRKAFPSNSPMLLAELEIFLGSNRFDEALSNLNLAIKNDSSNHILYFARGMIFNNKSKFKQAEMNYLKAISLKPDHYDSNFNLGALYFNQGADMITKAGDIPDFKEYEIAKKKGDAVLVKAIPYLEKALEIRPDDKDSMSSLMQLYGRTNQSDKYNEVKARMEGN